MKAIKENTKLHAVLGLAFGVAVSVGGTIGVGILRTPGVVAGYVGSGYVALFVWVAGALYVLLGVNSTAELATSIPRSGGPYAFAERIFGRTGGVAVGWTDFLNSVYAVAFLAVALAEYGGDLLHLRLPTGWIAAAIIAFFTLLNLTGVRTGRSAQQLTSLVKCLGLLGYVAICLTYAASGPVSGETLAEPRLAVPTILGSLLAFQLILGVYSGWRTPAYFAEEVPAARDVVRSLFVGAIVVALVYLSVNVAMVAVLPYPQLIASRLPAADAAGVVAAQWGWKAAGISIVTLLAVLSLPSTIQAVLMATSRSLHAMARDGLFRVAARVSKNGSPSAALLVSGAAALLLASNGTFESLFAAFALFGVFNNFLLVGGALLLRVREPELSRPYRAFGYPFSFIILMIIDFAVFAGFLWTNLAQSLMLILLVLVLVAVYTWSQRGSAQPTRNPHS